MLEVNGMCSVQIGAKWNRVGILIPESANVVCGVEAEGVRVFAQAVEIGIVWKRGP